MKRKKYCTIEVGRYFFMCTVNLFYAIQSAFIILRRTTHFRLLQLHIRRNRVRFKAHYFGVSVQQQ